MILLTATGVELQSEVPLKQVSGPVSVPSPSCPKSLSPQQSTPPLASTAQVWSPPAAIAVAFVMPLTATGVTL